MTQQESVELPDYSLVSWRRAGDSNYTGGLVLDGHVWSLADVPAIEGDIIRACLLANVAGTERLADVVTTNNPAEPIPLDAIELGPPVPNPDKILCLGLNYLAHIQESRVDVPAAPVIFSKFRNSLVGPNDPVVLPRVSTEIDFEGELAVVIGRKAKHIDRDEALEYVAGYSVFNDVSARDIQLRTSQYTAGKALDTFAPMGPGLVPAALIPNPQDLMITTTISGEVRQQDSTSLMIFGVAETIAYLSSLMTLEPGDIIATGTPAGVGYGEEPPRYLKAGDVVEITIPGIGTLRNPMVAEDAASSGQNSPNETGVNEVASAGTW